MEELARPVCDIARRAGAAIMAIYETDDFGVEYKDDDSPLTRADKAANDVIAKNLQKLNDLPIISEENDIRWADSQKYWLVDPLDGTKEFVKRNGEFTVNIALIDNGRPVLGVVYAPAIDVMYWGGEKIGAFKQTADSAPQPIKAEYRGDIPTVVASRSHRDENLQKFLADLGEHKEINMGSSLKLCLVAEGSASVYPRPWPTYLWDTAAAHAVVNAAGGSVRDFEGRELTYSLHDDLKNPFFVVRAANF